jgi:hypothetical protein
VRGTARYPALDASHGCSSADAALGQEYMSPWDSTRAMDGLYGFLNVMQRCMCVLQAW